MPKNDDGYGEVFHLIDVVQRKYPRLAPFLDIPQVGKLILLLAGQKIEPDEFERRLRKTHYWKTTSEAQRRWKILRYADNATAVARVDARTAKVRDMIAQAGIDLPRHVNLRTIANRSLSRDWSEEQLADYIYSFASYRDEGRDHPQAGGTPNAQYVPQGALGQMVLQLRDLAKQYMIDVDPRTTFNNAKRVLSGLATVEGLQANYAQRALTRWGDNQTIANTIAKGGTVADYFEPYQQMIAEELELPSDGVDLMQARFREILNHAAAPYGQDQGGGLGVPGSSPTSAFRPMSLTEARAYIRSKPEWNRTRNAETLASGVGEEILRRFGAVA